MWLRSRSVEEWRAGPGAGLDPGGAADLEAMFRAYDESGLVDDPEPLARLLDHPAGTWVDVLREPMWDKAPRGPSMEDAV